MDRIPDSAGRLWNIFDVSLEQQSNHQFSSDEWLRRLELVRAVASL